MFHSVLSHRTVEWLDNTRSDPPSCISLVSASSFILVQYQGAVFDGKKTGLKDQTRVECVSVQTQEQGRIITETEPMNGRTRGTVSFSRLRTQIGICNLSQKGSRFVGRPKMVPKTDPMHNRSHQDRCQIFGA